MAESKSLARKEVSVGSAAVDGLLAGIGAGLVMALYLVVAALALGESPATMLGRFDPGPTASPVAGLLAHLAVASVYGALFGAGWKLSPIGREGRRASLLCGVAFGLGLWLLAQAAILPAAAPTLLAIPPAHFAIAHALYGLTLGLLFHRARRE